MVNFGTANGSWHHVRNCQILLVQKLANEVGKVIQSSNNQNNNKALILQSTSLGMVKARNSIRINFFFWFAYIFRHCKDTKNTVGCMDNLNPNAEMQYWLCRLAHTGIYVYIYNTKIKLQSWHTLYARYIEMLLNMLVTNLSPFPFVWLEGVCDVLFLSSARFSP